VTEKYYAKYDPHSAAKQLLRVIDGGQDSGKNWYQNRYHGFLVTFLSWSKLLQVEKVVRPARLERATF
jgi:hypothetical protein